MSTTSLDGLNQSGRETLVVDSLFETPLHEDDDTLREPWAYVCAYLAVHDVNERIDLTDVFLDVGDYAYLDVIDTILLLDRVGVIHFNEGGEGMIEVTDGPLSSALMSVLG